jgi:hypothetical protein
MQNLYPMKNVKLFFLAAVAGTALQSEATVFFNENFSQFTSGDLVGQNGWAQLGSSTALPLQVAGGQVVMTGGLAAEAQDAWRSLGTQVQPPATGTSPLYIGLSLTVDQATSAGKNPSYFLGMSPGNLDGSGFVNLRLSTTNDLASGPDSFRFVARVTGQSGAPWSIGEIRTHGLQYKVIMEANLVEGTQNDFLRLFVNPTGTDVSAETPDLVATLTSGGNGTDPTGLGAFILSQFGSSSTESTGVRIGQVVVGDNFAEVVTAVPEPSVLTLLLLGSLVFLGRRTLNR